MLLIGWAVRAATTLAPDSGHPHPRFFALLHATGALRLGVLQHLNNIIYEARLRATMPRTLDERIVIVDLDEKRLAELGWPWSLSQLVAWLTPFLNAKKSAC